MIDTSPEALAKLRADIKAEAARRDFEPTILSLDDEDFLALIDALETARAKLTAEPSDEEVEAGMNADPYGQTRFDRTRAILRAAAEVRAAAINGITVSPAMEPENKK
jgi:hypothetical protein